MITGVAQISSNQPANKIPDCLFIREAISANAMLSGRRLLIYPGHLAGLDDPVDHVCGYVDEWFIYEEALAA